MKKVLFIFLISSNFIFGQSGSKNMTVYNVDGMGSIEVSNRLSPQTKEFRLERGTHSDANEVFMQNTAIKSLKNSYARIIITNQITEDEEYPVLNPSYLSQEEIDEGNELYKQNAINEIEAANKNGINLRLIEWRGTSIAKMGLYYCIRREYTRQLDSEPIVLVVEYVFFNKDRINLVTISYRIEDLNIWATVMDDAIKSIKLNDFTKSINKTSVQPPTNKKEHVYEHFSFETTETVFLRKDKDDQMGAKELALSDKIYVTSPYGALVFKIIPYELETEELYEFLETENIISQVTLLGTPKINLETFGQYKCASRKSKATIKKELLDVECFILLYVIPKNGKTIVIMAMKMSEEFDEVMKDIMSSFVINI